MRPAETEDKSMREKPSGTSRRSARQIRKAVKHLVSLVKASNHIVQIVCGDLQKEIFADTSFVARIEEAVRERRIAVRIWTGPDYDPQVASLLRALGCEVNHLDYRPLVHFTVGDTDKIRFEGLHRKGVLAPGNTALDAAPLTAAVLLDEVRLIEESQRLSAEEERSSREAAE